MFSNSKGYPHTWIVRSLLKIKRCRLFRLYAIFIWIEHHKVVGSVAPWNILRTHFENSWWSWPHLRRSGLNSPFSVCCYVVNERPTLLFRLYTNLSLVTTYLLWKTLEFRALNIQLNFQKPMKIGRSHVKLV